MNVKETKKSIIQAGHEAVKELIKVAKEPIVETDDDVSADRLKNAAATKKLAIFDAFEILNRIEVEKALLDGKNIEEMCNYIEADSLEFLSVDGLYHALINEKRNVSYPQFSDHYFTGDYPVKPIDELGDNKITQLSLLNTASNN